MAKSSPALRDYGRTATTPTLHPKWWCCTTTLKSPTDLRRRLKIKRSRIGNLRPVSFLPPFLPSFLPSFHVPSFVRSFLPSPSFLPSFLPLSFTFLPSSKFHCSLPFILQASAERIKYLCKMNADISKVDMTEIDNYGWGNVRSFETYLKFSGIDLMHKDNDQQRCGT